MNRKRKTILFGSLAAILLVGVIAIVLGITGSRSKNGREMTTGKTYKVEQVAFSQTIEVSGNIEPIETEDLKFPVSGQIVELTAEEGLRVSKGDLIARLDDISEVYALRKSEYALEEERISGSRKNITLYELEVEMRQGEVNKRKLTASFAGTISSVNAKTGDWISQGSPIARIIDTSSLVGSVEIDEMDVPYLAVGQEVRFIFDAFPELEVIGRVSELPIESRVTNQGIAVLDVEVRIDNPPAEILPGFTFIAEIEVGDTGDILILDKRGILEMNGRTLVMIPPTEEGGVPQPKPVQVSEYENGKYRILSGLSAGDLVMEIPELTGEERASGTNPLQMFGFPVEGPGSRMIGGGAHPGGGMRGGSSGGGK
ncbi:MAG: HlyD family efflux transporter periplasmic adaptor subunit [Spirochaetales bacterium]|jgi:multidrug efflux pump subunit AcrA (membrane-fusion protein)|nr:HlyD family efflux transporter periplasmic adaptor subunit [Spirochaetales bacterium]